MTIITGVVLGSAASITLGLAVVIVIFYFTGLDEPRVADEFEPLAGSVGLFAILTAISATSFIGLLKEKAWRWLSQAAMWACLLLVAGYYWP
ncbi:MAG: hypothetical protein AB8F65_09970 [Woeseiaceae bacterium]